MSSIRIPILAAVLAAAIALPARAGTEEEVRAAFEKFVAAQNAHDPQAVQELLLDSKQFLWITRGMLVWGRDSAIQRFTALYQGTWKLEPEWAALRVMPAGSDTAHLMVPVTFTTGAAAQAPAQVRVYLNQLFVKTPSGWRVTSILPIPAPAP